MLAYRRQDEKTTTRLICGGSLKEGGRQKRLGFSRVCRRPSNWHHTAGTTTNSVVPQTETSHSSGMRIHTRLASRNVFGRLSPACQDVFRYVRSPEHLLLKCNHSVFASCWRRAHGCQLQAVAVFGLSSISILRKGTRDLIQPAGTAGEVAQCNYSPVKRELGLIFYSCPYGTPSSE